MFVASFSSGPRVVPKGVGETDEIKATGRGLGGAIMRIWYELGSSEEQCVFNLKEVECRITSFKARTALLTLLLMLFFLLSFSSAIWKN